MAFEEVLVVPGATPRSADVVSADPITVRWEGADEDEVLPEWPKGCRRVGRGSLNHRILVDRGSVEAALASPKTSVAIVLQLLQDKSRALTVPEIKAALIGDFGLPKELGQQGAESTAGCSERQPERARHPGGSGTPGKRKPSTVMPRFEWQAGENDSSPASQRRLADHRLSKTRPRYLTRTRQPQLNRVTWSIPQKAARRCPQSPMAPSPS